MTNETGLEESVSAVPDSASREGSRPLRVEAKPAAAPSGTRSETATTSEHAGGQTSRRWWAEVKRDPARVRRWLRDQYRGEATAADRIEFLRARFAEPGSRADRVLRVIADQERKHARWVAALLEARGLAVRIDAVESRYWEATLGGIRDLATGCAVGAHAERMRLERIEAIAADPEAPADVRAVFARILPQERFHERAFRSLSTAAALAETRGAHDLGREALGLVP